jgi:hypothetical protein
VHLFRPSLSFLAKAQPRLEIRRGQKNFLQKTSLEKVLTIFFIIFVISLPTKLEIYDFHTITYLYNLR